MAIPKNIPVFRMFITYLGFGILGCVVVAGFVATGGGAREENLNHNQKYGHVATLPVNTPLDGSKQPRFREEKIGPGRPRASPGIHLGNRASLGDSKSVREDNIESGAVHAGPINDDGLQTSSDDSKRAMANRDEMREVMIRPDGPYHLPRSNEAMVRVSTGANKGTPKNKRKAPEGKAGPGGPHVGPGKGRGGKEVAFQDFIISSKNSRTDKQNKHKGEQQEDEMGTDWPYVGPTKRGDGMGTMFGGSQSVSGDSRISKDEMRGEKVDISEPYVGPGNGGGGGIGIGGGGGGGGFGNGNGGPGYGSGVGQGGGFGPGSGGVGPDTGAGGGGGFGAGGGGWGGGGGSGGGGSRSGFGGGSGFGNGRPGYGGSVGDGIGNVGPKYGGGAGGGGS